MKSSLVSIIIPTYNRADLIGETIQSVFDQTYTQWELIIVDDGSEDNTGELISNLNCPKILYHRISHSGILGKVRNYGMRMAKGEYIAFLDSDDLWQPDKLMRQLLMLQNYQHASFVFSNGHQFGERAIPPPEYQTQFVGNVFFPLLMEGKFCIYMPSLIFKKEVVERIGLINEKWKGGGDIDFFYRLAYSFDGIFLNERLVKIRRHQHSMSHELNELSYHELIEMYATFYANHWLSQRQFNVLAGKAYYKLGFAQLKKREYKNAVHSFARFNHILPLQWKGWVRLLQSFFYTMSK